MLPIYHAEAHKVRAFLLDADKAYEAWVRFGVETDTLDRTGTVLAERPVAGLDGEQVAAALARFRGTIAQVPPMYSALKRDGRPLYAYARGGQTIDRAARRVTIHALELVEFAPPDRACLRVRCSKGTYVRALAADLGEALGFGAHLAELRRTASGPFTLARAITLDALVACVGAGRVPPMLSLLEALAHLPRVVVDEARALVLARGQRLSWGELGGPDASGPVCAVRDGQEGGALVAVVARNAAGDVEILRGFRGAV